MLNPLASTPANRSEPISKVSRIKGASFLMENLAFFGRKLTLGIMICQTEQLGLTEADESGWKGGGTTQRHRCMRPQCDPPGPERLYLLGCWCCLSRDEDLTCMSRRLRYIETKIIDCCPRCSQRGFSRLHLPGTKNWNIGIIPPLAGEASWLCYIVEHRICTLNSISEAKRF